LRLSIRTITFLALAAGLVPVIGAAAGVVPAAAAHRAAPARSAIAAPGGTQLWAAKYPAGTDNGAATALAVSPDQAAVYVTGAVTKTGGSGHRGLVAYNTATGARLWAVTYPLLHISRFQPADAPTLAVSPDGSTVFTEDNGHVRDNGETSVRAFSATSGTQLWLAKLPAMRFWGGPKTIAVSPDGSQVFITGNTGTFFTRYITVALNAATGQQDWSVLGPGASMAGRGRRPSR
jgi:outer membrane protein assembly factor BamB